GAVAGSVRRGAGKAGQLAVCRACGAPDTPGVGAAVLHGVRFGVKCSLCCLGLMAVLLGGGMMHVSVVAAVAVAVALERLGPRPEVMARAIGTVVIALGALVLLTTAPSPCPAPAPAPARSAPPHGAAAR